MAFIVKNAGITVGDVKIINDLSVMFEAGQCWAVIGRNGTGKTTLLHALAGLRPVAHGDIELNGQFLHEYSHRQRAQKISLLLQDTVDVFPLSVYDAISAGRHPYRGKINRFHERDLEQIEFAIQLMELDGFRERDVTTLSGGERRRVAIACVIAQDTPYVFLDEPINHLDLHYQISVLNWAKKITNETGKTVIMVLHDLNLCWRYCDHTLMLFGDGEFAVGHTTELLEVTRLSRLYGHKIETANMESQRIFFPSTSV